MIGRCDLLLETSKKIQSHEFYIVPGYHGSLRGYPTSIELDLIAVLNNITDSHLKNENLFKGIGKLKDIFQLQQHIQSPTRTTHTTSSLVDIILTYSGDSKTLEEGVIQLGISDHSLVYLCRKISIPKAPPKIVFTRQYKNYNVTQFNNDLNEVFNLPMNTSISNDPNALWNDFKTKLLSVADKHAPIRQRRIKREYKPWLTNQIKQMSYHRDHLKRPVPFLTIYLGGQLPPPGKEFAPQ